MKKVHIKEIELITSNFDQNKRLLPSAILDLFQVVAAEHSNLLGCGIDDLYGKNILWALLRTKYEVYCQPKMFQRVVLKTWPLSPSRVSFQREYIMEDSLGNVLIKGTSEWVVINASTRKIVSAMGIYPEGMEHLKDKNFENKLSKVPDFLEENEGYLVIPGYSQLDMNGHVNNTKYANYAIDAINPEREQIIGFQIDYRHEVQLNERISVFTKTIDKNILVKGCDCDGNIKFACLILIK